MGAMTEYIRAAALRGFGPLVGELGGDATGYLQRAGLDAALLTQDDTLVPMDRFAAALSLAGAELGRPDLPLRLSQRQDLQVLGPLAVGLENAPTVRAALQCAQRFLFVHSSLVAVCAGPDPRGEPGVVAIAMTPTDVALGLDLGLGLLHRSLTLICGGDYGLRGVHLPGAPLAPEDVYTEVFGAPVRFRTGQGLLRVPAPVLDAHRTDGDELLYRMSLAYLEMHAPQQAASTTGRVRQVLHGSLGASAPLIGSVARLLGVHPRTLQRRLADEGTTYEAILDDLRRERAGDLVTGTDLPFARIAGMVGFREPAAFTRACRRWYDASPRQLRRGVSSPGARAARGGSAGSRPRPAG